MLRFRKLFVLMCLCFVFIKDGSLEVQYISTLTGEKQCVASGADLDVMMHWNYWDFEDDITLLDSKTVFEPTPKRFNLSEFQINGYKLQSSLDYEFGLVLDRFWQDFPSVRTEYAIFSPSYPIKNKDFEIPLSIRAHSDVHIHLCNDKNYTGGECYRFCIDCSGSTKIKKMFYQNNSVKIKETFTFEHDRQIFDYNEWKHFILKGNHYNFTFLNVNGDVIFNWYDKEESYLPKNMFIANRNKAEYKIHYYNFLYTNSHDNIMYNIPNIYNIYKTYKISDSNNSLILNVFNNLLNSWKNYNKTDFINSSGIIREIRTFSPTEFQILKYNGSQSNPNCIVTKKISNGTHKVYETTTLAHDSYDLLVLPQISDFEDYNKSDTFVSLRWKTDTKEGYNIKCCNHGQPTCIKAKDILPCKIWKGYFCTTFANLNRNDDYVIHIEANQVGINGYKIPSITKHVILRLQVPTSPLEPSGYFNEDNSLTVNWKHPKRVNGPLQYFLIEVLQFINNKYRPIHEERYFGDFNTLEFQKRIEPPIDGWNYYGNPHILTIKAKNSEGYSDAVNFSIPVPPMIPFFNNSKIVISDITNSSAVINIPSPSNVDTNYSYLFILISSSELYGKNENSTTHEQLRKYCKVEIMAYSWIALAEKIETIPQRFKIGEKTSLYKTIQILGVNFTVQNKELMNSTQYDTCVVFMNEYNGFQRFLADSVSFITSNYEIAEVKTTLLDFQVVYYLAVLIPVVILSFLIYCCFLGRSKPRNHSFYREVRNGNTSSIMMNYNTRPATDGYLTPNHINNYEENLYEEIPDAPVSYDRFTRTLEKITEEQLAARKNYVDFAVTSPICQELDEIEYNKTTENRSN